MTITDPAHWKELYGDDKGAKYAKILEMIAELNTPTVAPIAHETSHRSGGADALTDVAFLAGNQTINGIKTFGSIPVLPASDPTVDNEATRKSYVDVHALSGKVFVPGSNFAPGPNAPMSSDGVNIYIQDTTDSYVQGFLPLPTYINVNGVAKYLKITQVKVGWNQTDTDDDLDRFRMRRFIFGTGTAQTCLDDTTNRGFAGYNTYSYTISTNNQLDATYDIFSIIIYYIKSSGGAGAADFRLQGCMCTYEYS